MPGLFEITRAIIIQVWTFINSKLQVQGFEWIAGGVASWVGDNLGKNTSERAEPTQSASRASILEAAGTVLRVKVIPPRGHLPRQCVAIAADWTSAGESSKDSAM